MSTAAPDLKVSDATAQSDLPRVKVRGAPLVTVIAGEKGLRSCVVLERPGYFYAPHLPLLESRGMPPVGCGFRV